MKFKGTTFCSLPFFPKRLLRNISQTKCNHRGLWGIEHFIACVASSVTFVSGSSTTKLVVSAFHRENAIDENEVKTGKIQNKVKFFYLAMNVFFKC